MKLISLETPFIPLSKTAKIIFLALPCQKLWGSEVRGVVSGGSLGKSRWRTPLAVDSHWLLTPPPAAAAIG